MFYFVKIGKYVKKYKVNFEKKELQRLRLEIINNCSEVIHRVHNSVDSQEYYDCLRFRKFRRDKIGTVEVNGEEKNVFHFSYDEYIFPYLVSIIDQILLGNSEAITKIVDPDFSKEPPTVFERKKIILSKLEKFNKDISKADSIENFIEREKNISKLHLDLQVIIANDKLNRSQKSVLGYYSKVLEILNFKLVDTLDLNDKSRIKEFFDIKEIDELDDNFQKILK